MVFILLLLLQEADRLKKAMKNERFRQLLSEYVDEISDPENKAVSIIVIHGPA